MKVYISADIEGCTGVASFSQCGRPDGAHFDYPFARRMMTMDINAAIRGARRAGATEVVVKDAHATCKNLMVDELEPGTVLISGAGSERDGMMDGIDESFDAAFLVGYHAMAGGLKGMMDHALVGGLHKFWVNDEPAGEILVSSAVAGAYGVPLVLVTSDEEGCREAAAALPGCRCCATKEGYGRYMGRMLHPSETSEAIEAAAFESVSRRGKVGPTRIDGAVTLRAEFRSSEEADLAGLLPSVRRIDAHTLEFGGPDFVTAHRLMLSVFQLSIRGRASGA